MRPAKLILWIFLPLVFGLLVAALQAWISFWWSIAALFILLVIFYLGVTRIQWNFFFHSYNSGSSHQKTLALTFDDGINTCTSEILDILAREQVPAAFFLIGKNILGNEDVVSRMDHEGHIVGNHSDEHGFHFDWKSSHSMYKELKDCNDKIQLIIGKQPLLMRPPYGICNPNLAKAITQSGMKSIGWNIRSFDTTIKDPQRLLKRLISKMKNGSIILLHDSQEVTASILTNFIREARRQGYTFERVDQLLQIDAYS